MGALRGKSEYEKFKVGIKLTRRQAMRAQCYQCNGFEESNSDCRGISCPMYQYRLYPSK